jgi:hypothetical protein
MKEVQFLLVYDTENTRRSAWIWGAERAELGMSGYE